MPFQIAPVSTHLPGETMWLKPVAGLPLPENLQLDTRGGRVRVEWEPQAPVTPLGLLVFFAQFL
jgi:hypothetical protein